MDTNLHMFNICTCFSSLSYSDPITYTKIMESPSTKSAHKFVKSQITAVQSSNATRGGVRCSPPHQAIKSPSKSRDEGKERLVEKNKVSPKTPPVKENTKSQDFKLHTQERAVKRALFNYTVATKFYIIEYQKKQLEKIHKMIEEEEVRMLRKEMIPRAQLMPFFDRPFFPQRSNRRSTVPREPSSIGNKCSSSSISCS